MAGGHSLFGKFTTDENRHNRLLRAINPVPKSADAAVNMSGTKDGARGQGGIMW